MIKTACKAIAKRAIAAVFLGAVISANAGLVEIKFATNNIGLVGVDASQQAFLDALANNGLNPATFGGVSGKFYYDDTTPGNANTASRTYNSAIESLSFSIANWFTQALTGIGNGGDIVVSNDITAQTDVDRIVARVACAPGVGAAGTSCVSQPFNFSYSLLDSNTGVTWVLDEFELFLQENGANNPLSGVDLPNQLQWESTQWQTRRVDLRFNPNCTGAACENIIERATISFLAVPEPGTLALVGLALLSLGSLRRRS